MTTSHTDTEALDVETLFGTRRSTAPLVLGGGAHRAGWFGGGPLPGWDVPRSRDGKSPQIVVAAFELGTLDARWGSARAVLYIDARDIGECTARLERGGPVEAHPPADPRTGAAASFLSGAARTEESWVPEVPELGSLGSKIGGRPGFLQQELADADDLAASGMDFVAQIDCEDRILPSKIASALCDGGLYLFASRSGEGFDFTRLALRWQY